MAHSWRDEHDLDPRQRQCLLDDRRRACQIKGVDDEEVLHPQRGNDGGNVDPLAAGALERLAVPGLTCIPVMLVQPLSMMISVRGTWCWTALIRPGMPAVEKGRVADGGDDRRLDPAVDVPLGQADAGAHRDLVPDGVKRRIHAEDGAADVAGHHHLVLLESQLADGLVDRQIGAAMRATGADGDRPAGGQRLGLGVPPEEIRRGCSGRAQWPHP